MTKIRWTVYLVDELCSDRTLTMRQKVFVGVVRCCSLKSAHKLAIKNFGQPTGRKSYLVLVYDRKCDHKERVARCGGKEMFQ